MCNCSFSCSSPMACCLRTIRRKLSHNAPSATHETHITSNQPSSKDAVSAELNRFGYKVLNQIANPREGVLVLSALRQQRHNSKNLILANGYIRQSCDHPLDRVCTLVNRFLSRLRVAIKQRDKRVRDHGHGHVDVEVSYPSDCGYCVWM